MAGSTFGKIFTLTTWGESHGQSVGAIVDGCPANLPLCEQDIQEYLDLRKPGSGEYSSKRSESDEVCIKSGIFEGKTTGTPICLEIKNTNQESKDYEYLSNIYRPGHADYTYEAKYGIRDYRGGGRASGRETAARVAAGAIAIKLLKEFNIRFTTFVKSIGPISIDYDKADFSKIYTNSLYMPDEEAFSKACEYINKARTNNDSVGGVVECIIENVPAGLGEPVFDKLDANLAKAIMSIGSVKGFEIGNGFDCTKIYGSQNNDLFTINNGSIIKKTNNSGGILGGISDATPIIFRAAIKPTPSIGVIQTTVSRKNQNGSPSSNCYYRDQRIPFISEGTEHAESNTNSNTTRNPILNSNIIINGNPNSNTNNNNGNPNSNTNNINENPNSNTNNNNGNPNSNTNNINGNPNPSLFEECEISISGRHDTIIAPRASIVIESMAALTIADLFLQNLSSNLDKIKDLI